MVKRTRNLLTGIRPRGSQQPIRLLSIWDMDVFISRRLSTPARRQLVSSNSTLLRGALHSQIVNLPPWFYNK